MAGYLTTHVLDTARGRPAAGVRVTLQALEGDQWRQVATAVTNADGRTDEPILDREAFRTGTYQLIFAVGDYLADAAFLTEVPVRFTMAEEAHYHVPLLLSPYGYSTYRGS